MNFSSFSIWFSCNYISKTTYSWLCHFKIYIYNTIKLGKKSNIYQVIFLFWTLYQALCMCYLIETLWKSCEESTTMPILKMRNQLKLRQSFISKSCKLVSTETKFETSSKLFFFFTEPFLLNIVLYGIENNIRIVIPKYGLKPLLINTIISS